MSNDDLKNIFLSQTVEEVFCFFVYGIVDHFAHFNAEIVFIDFFSGIKRSEDSLPSFDNLGEGMRSGRFIDIAFLFDNVAKFLLKDGHQFGDSPSGFWTGFLQPRILSWVGNHFEIASTNSSNLPEHADDFKRYFANN